MEATDAAREAAIAELSRKFRVDRGKADAIAKTVAFYHLTAPYLPLDIALKRAVEECL